MASNPKLKLDFLSYFWSIFVIFGHFDEKNRSYPKKVHKISMSKNGVKTDLRPLFKEL